MLTAILALLGRIAPGLAATIGDIWLKSKQTQAAREGAQDSAGNTLVDHWLGAVTESNRARAAQGAWGPLGITTLIVGLFFALHIGAVVMDSLPLLPGIGWAWFIPYPTLVPHAPCRCVLALPDAMQAVELEAIRALFYTAPPAAAAVAIAKAFRR